MIGWMDEGIGCPHEPVGVRIHAWYNYILPPNPDERREMAFLLLVVLPRACRVGTRKKVFGSNRTSPALCVPFIRVGWGSIVGKALKLGRDRRDLLERFTG